MDLVEIDPRLFVTCRLCLEDTGTYQIVPKIQEQIKFCFDIDVEPFDGLPQLLCKNCNAILNDFYTKKSTLVIKQNTLKAKFQFKKETSGVTLEPKSCAPQQETVSSSQENYNEDQEHHLSEEISCKTKKKRAYLSSTSTTSEEIDLNKTAKPVRLEKKKKRRTITSSSSFEVNYIKRFLCTVCRKNCKNKGSFAKHFIKHNNIVSEFRDVFKKYCAVRLNKIDDKPNMTGVMSTVVHGPTKIISNDGNMNKYYVLYTPKDIHSSNVLNECEYSKESVQKTYSDSSDDECFVRRTNNKRRLFSRSSNDTVVLEGKSKSPVSSDNENQYTGTELRETGLDKAECININDSSDSDSSKSNIQLRSKLGNRNSVKAKHTDYKKIYNIALVCRNKFMKKSDSESDIPANTESQLKHKILNMGRKVINKQGFNCTGLLRYMEHKNLECTWIPRYSTINANGNKETNYVRIMPKLRGKEKCVSDNLGWKYIPELQTNEPLSDNTMNQEESYILVNQTNTNTVNVEPPIISSNETLNEHPKDIHSVITSSVEQAILYSNFDAEMSSKNKLLNENPVANPKQLPKKSVPIETKLNASSEGLPVQNAQQNSDSLYTYYVNKDDNADGTLHMPIITSTTSLAALIPDENGEKNDGCKGNVNSNSAANDSEKSIPRIKVKPVSELMSERVLQNLNQQAIVPNIWGSNQSTNIILPLQNTVNHMYVANMVPMPQNNSTQSLKTIEIVPIQSSTVVSTEQDKVSPPPVRQYVTLHTAELPNTKTDSPFRYFKQLLCIHNISLMDVNADISQNFVCLIKFKLQYKQDTVDEPVVLYLTFLCSGNKFYLGVKHIGQENNIDLNKLPANWQWEILNKIYQEEVVNKILKNAEKVNASVYEYTKSFLCLLKSIQFKRDTQ